MKKFFASTDKTQRRAGGRIIKFLALMLVFTIVARGADGATLARVNVSAPNRSDIVDIISGQATVSVVDTYEIYAIEGLTITEMHVTTGQNISIGDAVATFKLDELDEKHIRETAALNRMRHDLELLHRNNGTDSTPVETARRNLRRAQDDYAATVRQGEEDIQDAMQELTDLLDSMDTTETNEASRAVRDHRRAVEDYYSTLAQGQADIEDAQNTLSELLAAEADDSTLQTAIRNHERNLQDYAATVEQGLTDIAAAQETLDELLAQMPEAADRTALDAAQRNLARAREDRDNTHQSNQRNMDTAQTALDNAWFALQHAMASGDDALIATHWAGIEQAEAALEAAENSAAANLLPRTRAVEDAERELARAQQNLATATETELERLEDDIERAQNALTNATTRAAEQRLTAKRNVENTEHTLAQTQRNFDDGVQNSIDAARDALETAENRAASTLASASRILEDATHALNAELERAGTDVEQAQAAIQNAITRAENNRRREARTVEDMTVALRNAEQAHSTNLQQGADTTRLDMITATTLPLDIANKENLVNELAQLIATDGVLYATTAGLISATSEQGTIVGTAPIATLQITGGGFEARMHMPSRDAERLTIGAEAQVTTAGSSIFFVPTETATVSAISAPDTDGIVTVTLRLPGNNWTVGQRTDAEIVISRVSYDISVPISALRSDDAGYFLYIVEQHSTVLGVQNIVMRANVTVNAYDNNNVSVSGAVWRQSQVIVGSNKAVSVGDRVRVN